MINFHSSLAPKFNFTRFAPPPSLILHSTPMYAAITVIILESLRITVYKTKFVCTIQFCSKGGLGVAEAMSLRFESEHEFWSLRIKGRNHNLAFK